MHACVDHLLWTICIRSSEFVITCFWLDHKTKRMSGCLCDVTCSAHQIASSLQTTDMNTYAGVIKQFVCTTCTSDWTFLRWMRIFLLTQKDFPAIEWSGGEKNEIHTHTKCSLCKIFVWNLNMLKRHCHLGTLNVFLCVNCLIAVSAKCIDDVKTRYQLFVSYSKLWMCRRNERRNEFNDKLLRFNTR